MEWKSDHETILIGHSAGAITAMRLAPDNCWEQLVGSYHTDLGICTESRVGILTGLGIGKLSRRIKSESFNLHRLTTLGYPSKKHALFIKS